MRRVALMIALAAGCSSSSQQVPISPELAALIDAKPANGYQVVLPEVKGIAPGSDSEYCTWTSLIAPKNLDIRAVQAYQTVTGHHVVMFTTTKQQPPGTTRLCTDDDMASFRFGAGAGGEGQSGKNQAPGNLVFRVPAGDQIVLNHHYINATTQPHDAQSAMNIWLADPGVQYTPSGAVAILDTTMSAPPGQSTLDINCTMQNDIDAWLVIPHMHQWGQHAIVELITAGNNINKLFDVDWSPSYQFHPPEIVRDPSMPFHLATGDQVHVRCEWNNTTSRNLGFGLEMCVSFLQTIDDKGLGNQQCDHGIWGTF
jgi:hypothetical protein